jgi:hypothetical protein
VLPVLFDIVIVIEGVDSTGCERKSNESDEGIEEQACVGNLHCKEKRKEDEEVFDVLVRAHEFDECSRLQYSLSFSIY